MEERAIDMLQAAHEAHQEAHERHKNAQEMMASCALSAFVEGTSPAEIAKTCGFGKEAPSGTVEVQTPFGMIAVDPAEIGMDAGAIETERFAMWLSQYVYRRITEALGDG